VGPRSAMRVILDSNVLLSSLISPYGTSHAIYNAWRSKKFELVTSNVQLEEIRQASRYPKLQKVLRPHCVGTMVNNMQRAVVLERLQPLPKGIEADDPNDSFLLAMAVSGRVDYLVTGDRESGLLQRGNIGHTCIVTPSVFCSEVLKVKFGKSREQILEQFRSVPSKTLSEKLKVAFIDRSKEYQRGKEQSKPDRSQERTRER